MKLVARLDFVLWMEFAMVWMVLCCFSTRIMKRPDSVPRERNEV